MRYFIREDDIEKELIDVCTNELGYNNHFNCFTTDHLHRSSEREVLNVDVLRGEIRRINSDKTDLTSGFDDTDVDTALAALTEIDLHSDPKILNKRLLTTIIQGYSMEVLQADGRREKRKIQYVDWDNPSSNQFDVVNQLWIQGDVYRLRPDVIIYVNGLPLIAIELKDSNIPVKNAYDDNLTRYKNAIPKLMAYNAILVASNGTKTKIGSTYASWTFFSPWFRASENDKIEKMHIEDEKISLDVMARSLLEKNNLLNYIRNFILFYNSSTKICAKNHQFLGVNNAVERYKYLSGTPLEEDHGKLGVFWHTQGSGKSFSMVFLARYLKNRFPRNFTFLIITDREDLDDQIYRNFLHSGFMSEAEECRPASCAICLAPTNEYYLRLFKSSVMISVKNSLCFQNATTSLYLLMKRTVLNINRLPKISEPDCRMLNIWHLQAHRFLAANDSPINGSVLLSASTISVRLLRMNQLSV